MYRYLYICINSNSYYYENENEYEYGNEYEYVRRVLASARKKSEIVLSLSLSNAPNRALKVKFRNEASQLNLKLCYLKDLKNGKNERSDD